MIVDSHFHVWDPHIRDHAWLETVPFPALRRVYTVAEYSELIAASGVVGGVLVQVLNDLDETREFLAVAAAHPSVLGVVGWVDLEADDVGDTIASLREAPGGDLLVGVRHLVQAEHDPRFMERPSVIRGLRAVAQTGLPFDLLVSEDQLASALAGIRQVEDLQVVLDHAGKPTIAGGPSALWTSLIRKYAATERVVCKLSGLVTEAGVDWSQELLRPFTEEILETFGPERTLFGSDWPVLNAVASYEAVLDLLAAVASGVSAGDRKALMGGTASHVYGLRDVP